MLGWPAASFFFGAHIRLRTILGRFSINYFSGLGLRVKVGFRVSVVITDGQGKFRVRVIHMFGSMVMVRVNTSQNLNLDPNPQNGIVEGHP